MSSLNPLSYSTIADWARLTGHRPSALDVQALLQLDAVMLMPGDGGEE